MGMLTFTGVKAQQTLRKFVFLGDNFKRFSTFQ